ncbi:uncharacterized protein B0H64DRAFT_390091 [Chaetomium fimeti]|uniref:C2H2-type domain-containing protein n=1 Tax=Chaetomium fimeti TaxID=1854472 RepID=A0AAE0HJD9_9PEZI|nr:hypothetical protein B0H64DRAFT_390091 [Chaetomium fimeti]
MCRYSAQAISSSCPAEDRLDSRGADMADCRPPGFGSEPDWWLRSYRIESYFADRDSPFAFPCDRFRIYSDEPRNRAIAEIDGVAAGLTFLDKLENLIDVFPERGLRGGSSATDLGLNNDDPYPKDLDIHGDDHQCALIHGSIQVDLPAEPNLDESFGSEPDLDFPVEKTGDVGKAWRGLGSLRRGMKAEFRRFNEVASRAASTTMSRLRSKFPSSRALADCGTLVYRDVLDGLCPSTLEEIFAFASLSHAMSRILVRQKRMEDAQVLLGVQRWRDCIGNVDEKSVFDTLASEMWPSSCMFSTQPERAASGSLSQAIPGLEGLDNTSQFLKKAANITATEMGHIPGDVSHTGDTGPPPSSLEDDVLNITERTAEEFNFSQLCRFGDGDPYLRPMNIEPRELSKSCGPDQPIPGYNPPHFHRPPLGGHSPASNQPPSDCHTSPVSSSLPSSSSCGQRFYRFPVTDEVFDCKAINLRNTVTFLAVLAFASDWGDGFYLFSGSGKTAAHNRTGSAWARERSKTERKLRREFFDPLKKVGTDDAGFLALLAVAKRFVVLGLLGTKDEVQDYLIAISKEFLTCGDRQAKFARWVLLGQSPSSTAASSSKPEQQNKRRKPSERQLGDGGPTRKKQCIYRCEHPGCGGEYHSASGLSKHKKKHLPVTEIVRCDVCEYSSDRRDLVRQHFLRQHGPDLPPYLQEVRRGHR